MPWTHGRILPVLHPGKRRAVISVPQLDVHFDLELFTQSGSRFGDHVRRVHILLLNKALALNRQGKKNEAVAMLGTLALDPQSTLGTETLAKFTLLQITSGK